MFLPEPVGSRSRPPVEPSTDARLAAVEAELLAGLNGAAEVAAVHRIAGRSGEIVDWPRPIDPRLQAALVKRGIERPYAHQAAAIGAAMQGRDVVLATACLPYLFQGWLVQKSI